MMVGGWILNQDIYFPMRRALSMRWAVLVCALALVGVTGIASAYMPVLALATISGIGVVLILLWLQFDIPASVLLLCGTVDITVQIRAGAISLMGLATIVVALSSWLLWLIYPSRSQDVMSTTWPLLLYGGWSLFSASALFKPRIASIQNLLVTLGFVGLLLLSASAAASSSLTYERVGRILNISVWAASALHLLSPVLHAVDPRLAMHQRPFALFALLGLAWLVAQGRHGRAYGYWQAAALTVLIIASLSRTAMAVALLFLIVSRFSPSSVRGWTRFLSTAAAVGTIAYLGFTRISKIRERFVQGDVSMTVGGFSFNTEGRTAMWNATQDSFLASPWIGNGIGSATHLIETQFPGLGHPHNDYLRILHDLGILGMGLWLIGVFPIIWIIGRAWLRLERQSDPRARIHLTALLTLLAILLTMVTDNVVVYAFVMLPAAVIIGTSIGTMESSRIDPQSPRGSGSGTK